LGKPLIAWIIAASKGSKHVTRSIVSTDDNEIAAVARSYGAEVPFIRPAEIALDLSTDMEFLVHALDWLRDKEDYEPEIVVRLPPTSPLCTAAHIDEGIEKLLSTPEADAVRPIVEVSKHPYKMWKISSDGCWLEPFLPEALTGLAEAFDQPRQLYPKVYIHTGAMDVMRLSTIRDLKSKAGRRLSFFMMRAEDSVNIDDQVDFDLAELVMKRRFSHSSGLTEK
jgi:N-acylneuraminate cytidylyltransferase